MAYRQLTDAMVEQFLTDGYIHLQRTLDRDFCQQQINRVFALIDCDPNDNTTWSEPRLHLPSVEHWPVQQIAPDVHAAMADLLGGEDRMNTPHWSDAFIINFSFKADDPQYPPPIKGGGWHKDGDFFRHYLDSPEQALLVFVCWSDVVEQGGATFLAPQSPGIIARDLAQRPQGYLPTEMPTATHWLPQCDRFVQTIASQGDVFLLHPFMLHAASANVKRALRVITNPPVNLVDPMKFDRENLADHSLVEQSILRALGVEQFTFTPPTVREKVVPERVKKQNLMRQQMQARQAGNQ